MRSIRVKTTTEYDVRVGAGLLSSCGETLRALLPDCRKVILCSDTTVAALYASRAETALASAGFSVSRFVFSPGEASKTPETLVALLQAAAEKGLARSDAFVALGGGVVGDLTGLAASLYQRGCAYMQIPTTLLSAVDASVGGKTAVNLPGYKNYIGSFWQPITVLVDTDLFATLPSEIFRQGMAEAIKTALLAGFLERVGSLSLEDLICEAVSYKAMIVAKDEQDHGSRRLLNLGHTIAHTIEERSAYAIPHGEAVSMGLSAVLRASSANGKCGADLVGNVERQLIAAGLPTTLPCPMDELIPYLSTDKKRMGERLTVIVPYGEGDCRAEEMTLDEAAAFFRVTEA